MNAFYWTLIFDIVKTTPSNKIQENVYVIQRIIESYPCAQCKTHFNTYIETNPMNVIQSKNDLILYMQKYRKDIAATTKKSKYGKYSKQLKNIY